MRPDTGYIDIEDWIPTLSGGKIYFNQVERSVFTIEDIAYGLANCCRFAGQVYHHYSVAQHSLLVSETVPKAFALQGLLHDASEAFLADIVTPAKKRFPAYIELEGKLMAMIAGRFGLRYPFPPEVKAADLRLLATEKRDLLGPLQQERWAVLDDVQPLPDRIIPMPPQESAIAFMNRFSLLYCA